jgi:hypothetical protein
MYPTKVLLDRAVGIEIRKAGKCVFFHPKLSQKKTWRKPLHFLQTTTTTTSAAATTTTAATTPTTTAAWALFTKLFSTVTYKWAE